MYVAIGSDMKGHPWEQYMEQDVFRTHSSCLSDVFKMCLGHVWTLPYTWAVQVLMLENRFVYKKVVNWVYESERLLSLGQKSIYSIDNFYFILMGFVVCCLSIGNGAISPRMICRL